VKSEGFIQSEKTESWFNLQQRKHFTAESFADMTLEWLRAKLDESVPDGQFWVYSYHVLKREEFERLVAKYKLHDSGLTVVAVPSAI
jgi:hypothetical protein